MLAKAHARERSRFVLVFERVRLAALDAAGPGAVPAQALARLTAFAADSGRLERRHVRVWTLDTRVWRRTRITPEHALNDVIEPGAFHAAPAIAHVAPDGAQPALATGRPP